MSGSFFIRQQKASIQLPSTLETLDLQGHHKLSDLQLAGLKSLHTIKILDCPLLNVKDIIERVSNAGGSLNDLTLDNLNWEDVTLSLLTYLFSRWFEDTMFYLPSQ